MAYYGISKMADARRRAMVIGDWDREFLDCEQELLFDIIQAASYLDIKTLLFVFSIPGLIVNAEVKSIVIMTAILDAKLSLI